MRLFERKQTEVSILAMADRFHLCNPTRSLDTPMCRHFFFSSSADTRKCTTHTHTSIELRAPYYTVCTTAIKYDTRTVVLVVCFAFSPLFFSFFFGVCVCVYVRTYNTGRTFLFSPVGGLFQLPFCVSCFAGDPFDGKCALV